MDMFWDVGQSKFCVTFLHTPNKCDALDHDGHYINFLSNTYL